MGWLLASTVILAVSIIAFNAFLTTPAKQTAKLLTILGAIVFGIIVVVATSRLGAGAATLLGALFYFVFRDQISGLFRTLSGSGSPSLGGAASGRAGQKSTVETKFLRMMLDHESGEMDGEVLTGEYAGRALSDLKVQDLANLFLECLHAEESESATLIEKFVERQQPSEFAAFQRLCEETTKRRPESPSQNHQMSREEALAVLGLAEGADEQTIRSAHKTLMKKFHPDQEGSDYLARKINQARDTLLDL